MTSFVALRETPRKLVENYLGARGYAPDFIRWKYFDDRFNRDRNRGWAWIHEDRIQGMIGMVPGLLARGSESWPLDWAGDWSLEDPVRARGMGGFLLKQAAGESENFLALSGNEFSLKVLGYFAKHTVADAGIVFHFPLRLKPLLEKVGETVGIKSLGSWGMAQLPARWPAGPKKSAQVRLEAGVSIRIGDLAGITRGPDWQPRYDFEYVDWQIGRCPLLESATAFGPGDDPRAAVVLWRTKRSAERWRGLLLCRPDGREALGNCLTRALEHAYRNGGTVFSVMVSHSDTEFIQLLRAAGGVPSPGRVPIFLFENPGRSRPVTDLSTLSYIDSDYAHLF